MAPVADAGRRLPPYTEFAVCRPCRSEDMAHNMFLSLMGLAYDKILHIADDVRNASRARAATAAGTTFDAARGANLSQKSYNNSVQSPVLIRKHL